MINQINNARIIQFAKRTSIRNFTVRTEPKPRPSAQFLQSGYWTPERRKYFKILTIAFPFMIGSGIALGQQFFREEDQNLQDSVERERLRQSIEQKVRENQARQMAQANAPQMIELKNQ